MPQCAGTASRLVLMRRQADARAPTPLRRALERVVCAPVVLPRLEPHGEAPESAHVRENFARLLRKRPTASTQMPKRERAVAVSIELDDLDVRDANLLRVLLREEFPY